MVLTGPAEALALDAALSGTKIALCTAAPSDNGTLSNEVVGMGYSRQPWTYTIAQGNPSTADNDADVTFTATGSWGTVTHAIAVTDANEVRGIMQLVDPNDTGTPLPQTVNSGNDVRFAAGEFKVSLD